jgi:hypothetical protein
MASQNHSKSRGLARLIWTLLDTLIGYRHPPSTLQLTFLNSGITVTSHKSSTSESKAMIVLPFWVW